MNTSEVFFIIASMGFVILGVLFAIVLVYILRAFYAFSRILEKIEKNIDAVGDTTRELLYDIQGSTVYKFLFGRRKVKKTSKTTE